MNTETYKNNNTENYLDIFLSNAIYFSEYRDLEYNNKNYLILSKSIAYICSNINKSLSINDLCRFAGTNRTDLHYVFKIYLDKSPGKAINEIRMKYAQNMLINTSLRICEISDKLGYSDPNNFSTAFKAILKQTPSEFRNLRKKFIKPRKLSLDRLIEEVAADSI